MADIAINPVTRRVQFTGNTGLGPFAFTFNILADADIAVYKNTTLLTLTTDYTVSTNVNGTGSITLTGSGNGTALISSDVLTIIGGRNLERTTDFVTAGDLLASSLNEQLDSLVIMAQQLDEKMTRSFKVNPGDVFTDLEMPLLDDRKGKYLAFNSTTGDPEAGPDETDVTALAAITSDIATLADIEDGTDATDAIQTVAGISSNVTTVATNIASVNTNATNIASINTNATNITDIQNASTNAATATTKAAEAATSATAAAASQTAAAASAASAASSYDSFDDRYLGVKSSDPTVDNDGNALVAGALYFSSTSNTMQVYDGASWIAATSAGNVSFLLYEYTATSGQTTFSGADDNAATLSYTVNNIQVVMNGVTLDPSDYTATSGTSVVLASGAATGDTVNIYAFKSFTTADMVPASTGGTFAGNVAVTGDLTVDTNTLYVDSTNNRVGIEKSAPAFALDVKGECRFETDGGSGAVAYRFENSGTTSGDNSIIRIAVDGTTAGSFIQFGDADDSNRGQIEYNHNSDALIIDVAASEVMRIDSNGQIGVSGSTASFDTTGAANGLQLYYETDTGVATIGSYSGGGGTALTFHTNSGGGASSEAMRITSDGRLGLQNSSPAYTFEVHDVNVTGSGNEQGFAVNPSASLYSSTNNTTQFYMNDSSSSAGTHNYIAFRYQGSTIGDIDTTDNTTIRYNTFVGAHWSQTTAANIIRGTIMSTIDEMMEWTDFEHTDAEGNLEKLSMAGHDDYVVGQDYTIPCDEDGNTVTATATGQTTDKRLAKVKVSDVASDPSVYGVFGGTYADGDISVESLGASFVRIGSGVTVQNGDLIESAGDGTGRVQADDIIRSCTVAKITSTIAKETFADGSKLYPCTLHCG